MKTNNGIARKLAIYIASSVFSLIVAIAVLVAVERMNASSQANLSATNEAVNDRLFSLVNRSAEVQSVIQRLLRIKDVDSIEIFIGQFDTLCKTAREAIATAHADTTAVKSGFDSLETIDRKIIELFLQSDVAGANLLYISTSNPAFENLRTNIDTFRNSTMRVSHETTLRVRRINDRNINLTIVIAVVFILFGIIWGVRLKSSISAPLNRLIAMLKDIVDGNGDLTKRMAVTSNDELGTASGLINRFIEQQQTIIVSIATNAEILATSANDIRHAADNLAAQSIKITEESSTVSSSATETSGGMTSISASVEEMSSSISSIATATEEISATINEVAANCQKEATGAADAASRAKMNRDLMHKLGETTKQIDNILTTIDDIAEQTNMLALNATIEAASAGEAGRGFAVVATEVKSLARLTAQSTVQIADQIEQIKRSVAESINESEKILEVIEQVNSISTAIAGAVEEQSATINEVAKNINEASTASGSVSSAVSTGALHLSKMAANIRTMNGALGDNQVQIGNVQKSVSALAGLSTQLNAIVSKFKLR